MAFRRRRRTIGYQPRRDPQYENRFGREYLVATDVDMLEVASRGIFEFIDRGRIAVGTATGYCIPTGYCITTDKRRAHSVNAKLPQLPRVILYEGKDSQSIPQTLRLELLVKLLDKGFTVSRSTDQGRLENLGHNNVVVLGIFDLPTAQLGEQANNDELQIHDIRDKSAETILDSINASLNKSRVGSPADGQTAPSAEQTAAPKRWKPWFPVIDFDRCTNCMQCLSFCLFDVYGVTKEGKIQVQNQTNCKTDCPACSRVCPEVAILFPKYKAGPINGDEVNTDDVRREAMKVDISALLGGDIYSLLRDRSEKAKSRFSKERDDDRALKERQRCLNKLKSNFDGLEIPTEVLSSLPSMDQIQSKAQQAKQRAQQALADNAANSSANQSAQSPQSPQP